MNIKEIIGNKKIYWFTVIIAAAVLFMLFGNADMKRETKSDVKQELEQGLENVLASVKGAGEVSVFIMLEDNGVKNFEKDIRKNSETLEEKTVLSGTGSDPAVVKYSFPSVKGIIITAQGAENENVRQSLKEAAETALGVPAHRVCVLTGK